MVPPTLKQKLKTCDVLYLNLKKEKEGKRALFCGAILGNHIESTCSYQECKGIWAMLGQCFLLLLLQPHCLKRLTGGGGRRWLTEVIYLKKSTLVYTGFKLNLNGYAYA